MDDTAETLSLAALAELFEGAAEAVYAVDAEQRIVFVNRAAESCFNADRSALIGQHCYELVAGTDYAGVCICRANCSTICAARRGEPVADYDVLMRPPGAQRRWVSMGIVVARVEGFASPLAVHMLRDASARGAMLREPPRLPRAEDPDIDGDSALNAQAQRLTPREIEVLRLLASGATLRQIAHELVLSPTTVRNHVENLMGKLDAHSRLQAVVRAARLGLL